MADLDVVAKEVFQTLNTFNYTARLYDENGNGPVAEPASARRMMCYPKNLMVSLVDDDDNTRLTFTLGKSVHINDVMGLNQALRTISGKYNILFKSQQSGKVITPKNFIELASITEDSAMQVCEGMYGTSRSSYLRLENARMIVRHKNRIDDSQIGARGRCVESIFVENSVGERSLMPTTNLMAGRAMTQHVNQGGGFADPVGQQIGEMAVDYGNLSLGAQAAMTEAAGVIREACRTKLGKLRKTFERLSRPSSYANEAADMVAQANMLTETDEVPAPLDEVRSLLSRDVSEAVVECCCKAMRESGTILEGPGARAMTQVLGTPVERSAWDDFKRGILHLRTRVSNHLSGDLASQLGTIARVCTDDGLSNLFDRIATELVHPTTRDLSFSLQWNGDGGTERTSKNRMTPEEQRALYIKIAKAALRAANKGDLADRNEVVSEHLNWLNSFDPDRILTEIAWSPMDPSFDDGPYEAAGDSAIEAFDAQEFIHSPQMQDALSGLEPESDDNHIDKDQIMSALEGYLRHYIDMNYPDQIGAFDDVSDMAKEVYDQAVDALHGEGFVVEADKLEDGKKLDELITMGDVLLPKHDQGDGLMTGVTKTEITDPDDPDQHGPANQRYADRLMTLAGVKTSGLGGPGY